MGPDALTARECGRLGWMVEKVETWQTHALRRKDLFRVFDYLAVTPEGDVVFIQTTTRTNASSRRRKMQSSSVLPRLLKNPNAKVELWTWKGKDLRREAISDCGAATALGASGKKTSAGTRSSSTPTTSSSISRLHGRPASGS